MVSRRGPGLAAGLLASLVGNAGFALAACSGGRKAARDDAAATSQTGSVATARDAAAARDAATLKKNNSQDSHAAAVGSGTVQVVVHWPSPPPAAFVAAPACRSATEVAPTLTTTRLVIGAFVQIDGVATSVSVGGAPLLVVVHDCAVQPAAAVVGLNASVHVRSNGPFTSATLQHLDAVADRRRIQFPIIGHTVEVSGLAAGMYRISAATADAAAGTLLVTAHAAAVSNGDGRVQFTAAPGPHRIIADLPGVGQRAAVHAELIVHVIAGEEVIADVNFGAP